MNPAHPATRPAVATARLAGLALPVVGAAAVLTGLGGSRLGVPLGSPGDLLPWLTDTEPAVLAAAVLRLAGLGLCAYLGAVLAVSAVAVAAGWGRATAALLVLLPSFLRRAAVGGAGLTLAASTLAPPAATAASPTAAPTGTEPEPTAVMVKLTPSDPSDPADPTDPADPADPADPTDPANPANPAAGAPDTGGDAAGTTATTHSAQTPGDPGSGTTATGRTPEAPTTTSAGRGPDRTQGDSPAPPEAGIRTVAPGDSLWSIAREALEARGDAGAPAGPGDVAGEAEVRRYWLALIAANRDRLVAPDQPDLIFPGQELVLPTP